MWLGRCLCLGSFGQARLQTTLLTKAIVIAPIACTKREREAPAKKMVINNYSTAVKPLFIQRSQANTDYL